MQPTTPGLFLRLPPELLSQIFISHKHLLGLSDNFLDGVHDFEDSTCMPLGVPNGRNENMTHTILGLGSVSRYIRVVAWATPSLWSHIVVSISDTPSRRNMQLAGLASWLTRSKSYPVSIRLQYGPTLKQSSELPPDQESKELLPFIQVIKRHSSHLRDLCLVLSYESYAFFVEHIQSHEMLLLKRLTFAFHSAPTSPSRLHSSALPLTNSPSLDEVNLINMPTQTSIPALPWAQITRCHGTRLHIANALDLISNAPLETCTLNWTLGPYPASASTPILHSHLRSLAIEGNSTALLKFLTLPALESLRINVPCTFPSEVCAQLLQRSRCTLRSLDISAEFIPASGLVQCLEASPGLTELKVHNQKDRIHTLFGAFMLERLTLKDSDSDPDSDLDRRLGSMLAPRLRRLEVLGSSCRFDVGHLGRMLRSRWDVLLGREGAGEIEVEADVHIPRRLESFSLEAAAEVPTTVWNDVVYCPEVRKLSEDGMCIVLRVHT